MISSWALASWAMPRLVQDAPYRQTVLQTVENTRKWVGSAGRQRPWSVAPESGHSLVPGGPSV